MAAVCCRRHYNGLAPGAEAAVGGNRTAAAQRLRAAFPPRPLPAGKLRRCCSTGGLRRRFRAGGVAATAGKRLRQALAAAGATWWQPYACLAAVPLYRWPLATSAARWLGSGGRLA